MLAEGSNSPGRPLPLVARADLLVTPMQLRGENVFTIKSRASLDYFQLTAEQYAVLQLLDGTRDVEQLRADLLQQIPTCRPTEREVRQLAFDLFDKGLAYSNRKGQGQALADRQRRRRRKAFLGGLASLLYIKLPGFDPSWLMGFSYPIFRWLFHPVAIAANAILLGLVWLFVLVRFDQVVEQLPDPSTFASLQMLIAIWLTLGVAKVLHELGHAAACKRFGGECHEIGVAFLVFSPCLYCDVSDAATFRQRKHRLAVGAAGMYVELLLSAVAAVVWWHTEPGWLHTMSLCLFLVTNVSTIAFNLNPLLRYDGYFLLCDWLEMPNLRQRSHRVLHRFLAWHLAGVRIESHPRADSNQAGLLLYAVASTIYRWSFLVFVTLVLYALLKPYGLGAVGLLLGAVSALAALFASGRKLWNFVKTHRSKLHYSRRTRLTALGFMAFAGWFLFAPLPWSVEVPVVVQPANLQHVYVVTPGRLERINVAPGQHVQAGECLVELQNPSKFDQYLSLRTNVLMNRTEVAVHWANGDGASEASAQQAMQPRTTKQGRKWRPSSD